MTVMTSDQSLFQLFGGVRPMARALGLPSSNIATWKSEGRIPSTQQPHVLAIGKAKGLPITAEDVVFPLGRPVELVAAAASDVVCHRAVEAQKGASDLGE